MSRPLQDDSPLIKRCFGRADQTASGTPVAFSDSFKARSYLGRFATKALDMQTLRATLAQEIAPSQVLRMRDDEVLRQMAWRLHAGHIRITEEQRVWNLSGIGGRRPPANAVFEHAPSVSEPPPEDIVYGLSSPTTGPTLVRPSDEAHVDAQAQANTLAQAAQNGTPFCEVCEQARREQETQAVAA